jgi:hypothetical protein
MVLVLSVLVHAGLVGCGMWDVLQKETAAQKGSAVRRRLWKQVDGCGWAVPCVGSGNDRPFRHLLLE